MKHMKHMLDHHWRFIRSSVKILDFGNILDEKSKIYIWFWKSEIYTKNQSVSYQIVQIVNIYNEMSENIVYAHIMKYKHTKNDQLLTNW